MINQEKVALMTKLATYEDGEGKKSIPQSKYYREDYISLKMINTGIIVTLAYILVLAIIVFVNVEKMMTQIANMDFVKLGQIVLTYYIIIFVVYMIIAYIVYSIKFKRVRNSLNEYNGNLKKLYTLYKEDEKRSEARK
jgi:uncharacterized membrane protein